MATETTNKKTRVFMFIGPQTEMCKQGRLVPHGNYLRGAHTVTTPDEQLVRLCWPAFLKQFVHTGKCQPKKKVLMPGASPLDQGLHQLWRSIVCGSKSHSGALLPLKHLRPALFSVPHLYAPTHKGRKDRKYQKNRRAAACYCLFSLFLLAFSLPFLPHLSSPLVKSQADCQLRRPSFSTASPMVGVSLEQAI